MKIEIYTGDIDGFEICLKELLHALEIRKKAKLIKPVFETRGKEIPKNGETQKDG